MKKYNRWKATKMDTEKFQESIEWSCVDENTYQNSEDAAEWLQSTLTEACNYSMPRAKTVNKNSTYWWNSSIAEKRNE